MRRIKPTTYLYHSSFSFNLKDNYDLSPDSLPSLAQEIDGLRILK